MKSLFTSDELWENSLKDIEKENVKLINKVLKHYIETKGIK